MAVTIFFVAAVCLKSGLMIGWHFGRRREREEVKALFDSAFRVQTDRYGEFIQTKDGTNGAWLMRSVLLQIIRRGE